MWCKIPVFCGMLFISMFGSAFADRGVFDLERWDNVLEKIRTAATNQNISKSVIDETLKSPAFIPGIVKSDRKQTELLKPHGKQRTRKKWSQKTRRISVTFVTRGTKIRCAA